MSSVGSARFFAAQDKAGQGIGEMVGDGGERVSITHWCSTPNHVVVKFFGPTSGQPKTAANTASARTNFALPMVPIVNIPSIPSLSKRPKAARRRHPPDPLPWFSFWQVPCKSLF